MYSGFNIILFVLNLFIISQFNITCAYNDIDFELRFKEDENESLSSDKKTLIVSRQWSDSAYDSLIAIQTVDQIKSAVAGLSAVQSIEYEFTDA